MGSPQVTCSSEDDEAHISVIRKFACAFAAQVQWSAADGDALLQQHYDMKSGVLNFKAGEAQANIKIPLLNDPSGKTRHFTVYIDDVIGRDKKGEKLETKVVVANKAGIMVFLYLIQVSV